MLACSSWAADEQTVAAQTEPPAKADPGHTPFFLHTVEGTGGGLIVPMAYLVNPGPEGTTVGMPAVSTTFLGMSGPNLLSFAVSETLFRRVELSYALNRFDLGSLPRVLTKAGLDVHRHEVYMHNFNIRGLILEENSFGLPLPSVVAGIQFKVNGGIEGIDNSLNGTLSSIGFEKRNGVDYTLHFSKTFADLAFGRPVIATIGLRNSSASNIGYTGFSDGCDTTLEINVACLVTDKLAVGYEYRQKNNPYSRIDGIIEDEDDWHVLRAAYAVNDQLTVAAGWAYMGPVANSFVNCAWGIQLKYEF